ncbi:MAG: MarR family transcriptional regulator [Lentisphaerae bacterium]|nr:MarR family transcriptional regulator [Lentisphaerota bacterium]
MAVAPKKQKQWLKECFAAWKQTDVAYSRLAHSRNLSLNMVWAFECLSEHPEGVEPAVLADEAKLLRQSMTVVLNDLEDQGLVTREFHPTDRRRKMIKLTSRGKKVCREILDTIAQCELEALSGLGEEEQRLFFELNTRFCQGLATKLAAAANSSDK